MPYEPTVIDGSDAVLDVTDAERSSVHKWTERIRSARDIVWEKDYQRMRDDMEFAAGFQWAGQERMDDERYICNLVLRFVNQKVANLYARDPRVEAKRRKRMDYQMWDGRMESLQQAAAVLMNPMSDEDSKLAAQALMVDFTRGRQIKDLNNRVGETLKILFQWQWQNQSPEFKTQMKQLVRRAVTTGVGYLRLNFSRQYNNEPLDVVPVVNSVQDRMKRAQQIMFRLAKGRIQPDSPEIITLQALLAGVQATQQTEDAVVDERLIFTTCSSTAIIPDPECSCLRGFVGANWIAQEHRLPLEEVNSFFQTDIQPGGDLKYYTNSGTEARPIDDKLPCPDEAKRVSLFEVFDYRTKTTFFICDGWPKYVQPPQSVFPQVKGFWPIFALTFNDIEVEAGLKATIFPPSDVQVLRSSQREWNRSREALRQQRKANAPKYVTGKGWLTEADKSNFIDSVPNSVIEIEGAPPGTDVNKLIVPFQHAAIDGAAYDTGPLTQDMFLSLGSEDGPRPSADRSTATAATINEQARVVAASSNVDDLDDFLSSIAEAGGEVCLREFTMQTVGRVVGPGAAWPEADREEYINNIFLDIIASSSGKPNRALEIANLQQIAPSLIAVASNPSSPVLQLLAREALRRLDDRLELDDVFPTAMSQLVPGMQPAGVPTAPAQAPTRQGQLPAQVRQEQILQQQEQRVA